jgi:hypothetical protein
MAEMRVLGEGQSRGVPRGRPDALPAGHGQPAMAEMRVPGEGQSRGPAFGVASSHESKRLSPGGPDPQHH